MVTLRLKRFGRRHLPYYRLNAIDSRRPRDGKPIEELGVYDPLQKDQAKAVQFKTDRVKYWLGVGAQPSETVTSLLRKAGIEVKSTKNKVPTKAAK